MLKGSLSVISANWCLIEEFSNLWRAFMILFSLNYKIKCAKSRSSNIRLQKWQHKFRKLRHNQSSPPLLTFCVSSFPVSNMKLELPGPHTLDCPDCNPSAKTWRRVAVEFARGHPASEAWSVAAIPKKYSASPQRSAPPLPMHTHK